MFVTLSLRDVGDLAVGKIVLELEADDFALVRAQRVEQRKSESAVSRCSRVAAGPGAPQGRSSGSVMGMMRLCLR